MFFARLFVYLRADMKKAIIILTVLLMGSATDRENYNKMMGNLNTLIQGCDKLLGSIVEKARQLGSTIKL